MQPLTLATILGVSAIALAACGRTPTDSMNAAQRSPEVATLEADQPTGTARAATAAETQPDADELHRREAELAQREQELRVQQDELRRERERLDAGRGGGPATIDEQGSIDADQATQATAPTPGSSVIRKEPTSPIVVPPGTPVEIELLANVNTRIARVGDRVEGRLASDLVVGDRKAAIAGAAVTGRVTEFVPDSDTPGGVSALVLTFDSLQAANGATIPIVARYRTLTGLDGLAVAPRPVGDVVVRAGTVVTAQTETTFSLY
jgi:hypothetical protein